MHAPAPEVAEPIYRAREPSTLLLLLLTIPDAASFEGGGGEFDESSATHSISVIRGMRGVGLLREAAAAEGGQRPVLQHALLD